VTARGEPLDNEAVGRRALITLQVRGQDVGRDDRQEGWPVQADRVALKHLAGVHGDAVLCFGLRALDVHR
jgi:hypothetical protein